MTVEPPKQLFLTLEVRIDVGGLDPVDTQGMPRVMGGVKRKLFTLSASR